MLVVDDKATPASVLPRGSERRISDEGETVTFMTTTEEFFRGAHSGERVA